MKMMSAWVIVAVSIAIILTTGGEVSAQSETPNPNRKKARWDGAKMVVDVGGMTLGAMTLNPLLLGVSSGALVRNTYRLGKHSAAARQEPTTPSATAPVSLAPPESLVAVPGRPGYFAYPSNPNQLYYDADAVARINVLIANRAKDGQTIRYTVSGTSYEVPPGYTQVLTTPAGSIIAFERGDQAVAERFTLAEGSYEFRRIEQNWRFYSIDGSAREVAKGPNAPVDR